MAKAAAADTWDHRSIFRSTHTLMRTLTLTDTCTYTQPLATATSVPSLMPLSLVNHWHKREREKEKDGEEVGEAIATLAQHIDSFLSCHAIHLQAFLQSLPLLEFPLESERQTVEES